MSEAQDSRRFELADLILAIARELRALQVDTIDMCTPVESIVMRYIDRNPGTGARSAAQAAMLPSSNFSRVLRSLEQKGLVRREVDREDARRVSLHPTDRAKKNRQRLRQAWASALDGIADDPETVQQLNARLSEIESHLTARRAP